MIEAVVFDLGPAIVDFALNQAALLAAYQEACGIVSGYLLTEAPLLREQVDQVRQEVERRIGESRHKQDLHALDIVAVFASGVGGLGLEIPETLTRRVACLTHRALRAELHLPPENAQAIRDTRAAGFRLGLVSRCILPGDWTRELLDDLGLLELCEVVVLSSDAGIETSRACVYQTALDRLGIAGPCAVFVGDRIFDDVTGPKATGMRAILIRRFRREDPEPAGVSPDAIIDRLADLPAAACLLRDAAGV